VSEADLQQAVDIIYDVIRGKCHNRHLERRDKGGLDRALRLATGKAMPKPDDEDEGGE
jgi:hypothetical protein